MNKLLTRWRENRRIVAKLSSKQRDINARAKRNALNEMLYNYSYVNVTWRGTELFAQVKTGFGVGRSGRAFRERARITWLNSKRSLALARRCCLWPCEKQIKSEQEPRCMMLTMIGINNVAACILVRPHEFGHRCGDWAVFRTAIRRFNLSIQV